MVSMSEINCYLSEKPHIKEVIWKITSILEMSYKYDFEDDILKIVLCFLKQETCVTDPFKKILKTIL